MRKLTFIDLFCGAGGFSKGFQDAGFHLLGGIDSDPDALVTYGANFGYSKSLLADIQNVDDAALRSLTAGKNVDVIVGGPPCQGFSIAGKRLEDDPRNVLYREYLRIVRILRPKAIVLENVPTILSLFKGRIADEIQKDLRCLGYRVEVAKLCAADFGVPQLRNRVFFVAVDEKMNMFAFPEPTTPDRNLTCWDALSDLPPLRKNPGKEQCNYTNPAKTEYQRLMRQNSDFLFNHLAVVHKQQTIETISLVPDGGNYKDLPVQLQRSRKVNIAWTRMNSKKPCFTIDAGHNHHFHYRENRVPTVRESARIQSFPDAFRFYGTKTKQFRQVGNAVPPLVAFHLATSLRKAFS